MLETPQIIHTEPIHYAAAHFKVPVGEIHQTMDRGVQAVIAALQAQGRHPAGKLFTHHFRRPAENFDFEICFPVESPIQPHGEVYPAVWPGMTVARAIFRGDYRGLPAAWGELDRWLTAHHHHGRGEFWECYLTDPSTAPNPEDWRTELNWPLA